ncbi:MAG: hypothetical protein IJ356_03355 [Erysipelotrichaceae bacterium]|nr:hypothetical protein [Erysipelotrichaceae bacterium]
MFKLFVYLPATMFALLYGAIILLGGGSQLSSAAYCLVFLTFLGSGLLAKRQILGALFGILAGIILIVMGMGETGQIIKETPFGIALILTYALSALYLIPKKKKTSLS